MIDLNLEDYNYSLPQEKIALFPLEDRAKSKLLLVNKEKQKITHHIFKEISDLLPKNSVIFVNKTKVISARLLMKKPTGGLVEILCVEPILPSTDPQITMSAKEKCTWKCIVGGKRINPGMLLSTDIDNDKNIKLTAQIIEKSGQDAIVEFRWDNIIRQAQSNSRRQTADGRQESITNYELRITNEKKQYHFTDNGQLTTDNGFSFADVLEKLGKVPLPPYIKREVDEEDKNRYQTVYAKNDGSVAAPTAGLHFTDEVIDKIKNRGIYIEELTLHVGPGTFKPIDTENISEHKMHSELIIVKKSLLENLLKSITDNKYIIATGTTSLRTLETLYWVGVKILSDKLIMNNDEFELGQWDAYKFKQNISALDSISAIIQYLDKQNKTELRGRTELLIFPGYEFKIVKGLITNYHLPKSTLILLVAAFLGKELWSKAYDEALNNNYRFLSYGDSSLLLS
ncbi:MAG: S-adenosylmethionine:tRNA ribosyltransferase-isomerase [bacterium]